MRLSRKHVEVDAVQKKKILGEIVISPLYPSCHTLYSPLHLIIGP